MSGPVDRRAAIGAGLAAMAAASARPAAARAARPLALADIVVRAPLARDYAGTLQAVRAMGYSHFGFRLHPFSPREPAEPDPVRKARMVGDAGLKLGAVRLGNTVAPERQIDEAAAIGAKVLVLTTAPVFYQGRLGETTRAAFEAWLAQFALLAARARAAGVRLAYHNHWYDHAPLDGVTPLDRIAAAIAPRDLGFEVDLAWAYVGGLDPVTLVERLGPRVVSLHLKDVRAGTGPPPARSCIPGDGIMNYARLLPRIDRITHALAAVEVDAPRDALEDAARARAFVAGMRS